MDIWKLDCRLNTPSAHIITTPIPITSNPDNNDVGSFKLIHMHDQMVNQTLPPAPLCSFAAKGATQHMLKKVLVVWYLKHPHSALLSLSTGVMFLLDLWSSVTATAMVNEDPRLILLPLTQWSWRMIAFTHTCPHMKFVMIYSRLQGQHSSPCGLHVLPLWLEHSVVIKHTLYVCNHKKMLWQSVPKMVQTTSINMALSIFFSRF